MSQGESASLPEVQRMMIRYAERAIDASHKVADLRMLAISASNRGSHNEAEAHEIAAAIHERNSTDAALLCCSLVLYADKYPGSDLL